MHRGMEPVRLASMAILCLAFCAQARSELGVKMDAGVGHSDNIARTLDDQLDETIATVGIGLDWSTVSRRLEGDALIDLSYNDYLDNTFDSEVIGDASASLVFGIVPQRFTWSVEETFGQAQGDPFAAVTPANRENVNYFTTGPDWNIRIADRTFARLTGRYSSTTFDESDLDSDRTSGGLSLVREISQRSQLLLSAMTEQVEFDEPDAIDFERDDLFFTYSAAGGRTSLNAQLGYTWIKADESESDQGLRANLSATRRISNTSSLQLALGSQFTDSAQALRSALQEDGPGDSTDGIVASSEAYQNEYVSLNWLFSGNRTDISLGAAWHEDDYERAALFDRKRTVYEFSFTRHVSPTLELGLTASLTDEKFGTAGFDSDELRVNGTVSWNVGRRLALVLLAERSDRDTSESGGAVVENRAFLTAVYTLWRSSQ